MIACDRQPVGTSLHALKGQILAPFNLVWRLPLNFFRIEIDAVAHAGFKFDFA